MNKFYAKLDLPPLSKQIINSVDLLKIPNIPNPDCPMEQGIFAQRYLHNWKGFDYRSSVNIRTRHDIFDQWVKDNITLDFVDAGVNYTLITEKPEGLECFSTGAHTDTTRNFALIYLLESGGPDVQTVFYQEINQPLLRRPRTYGEDLTKLIMLDQIKIPLHTWVILDSRILHSVENLTRNRVAFQVGLLNNHWQEHWLTYPDPGYRNPVTCVV
jgi:hypothetical protein